MNFTAQLTIHESSSNSFTTVLTLNTVQYDVSYLSDHSIRILNLDQYFRVEQTVDSKAAIEWLVPQVHTTGARLSTIKKNEYVTAQNDNKT